MVDLSLPAVCSDKARQTYYAVVPIGRNMGLDGPSVCLFVRQSRKLTASNSKTKGTETRATVIW